MSYSSEAERSIRIGFSESGWNLYLKRGTGRMDPDETVRHGPAETLVVGERYVMLPVVESPTDLKSVMKAIDEMTERRNRQMQTITLLETPQDVTGLSLYEDSVKVSTPDGSIVSYEELIRALPTLTDSRR